MACYIYKFPDIDKPIYKIGKSNNPDKRHKNLSTSYISDITERWFLYPTTDKLYNSGMLFFIEKTIHKLFEKNRIHTNKEFFTILDMDIFIKQVLDYFESINMPLRMTRNSADLKDLYDYALDDSLDDCFVSQHNVKPIATISSNFTLNPYIHQLPILDTIRTWHMSKETAGKLILPPGIGKSYLTAFYLRELPLDTSVYILVPLISIKVDFETALARCEVKLKNIEVLVYNTARNDNEMYGIEADIIIYDEAHHICAEKNAKLVDVKSDKKLFLTATEKVIEEEYAFDMSDSKFGNYIYQMGIVEAIEKGLLANYKIFLSDWTAGLKTIIEVLQSLHRQKIIMCFNSVEKAKSVYKKILSLGFNAGFIHAKTKLSERATIIDNFTNNNFSILCNIGCISEGVNIPCIDTVMFMDKRTSNIGVIQTIGRGLRTHPDKDFCMVVVVAEMLTYKFIQNLQMYDMRLNNMRSMMFSSKMPAEPKQIQGKFEYTIDGIIDMVEIYTSKSLSQAELFIKRIKKLGIYTRCDYLNQIEEFSDDFPECPELEFYGFNWDNLAKSKNSYGVDECIKRITELCKIEKDKLSSIAIKKDKLIYLNRIDNRIDINIYNDEKNKIRINNVLSSITSRRALK